MQKITLRTQSLSTSQHKIDQKRIIKVFKRSESNSETIAIYNNIDAYGGESFLMVNTTSKVLEFI